jgi:hypothetical protein
VGQFGRGGQDDLAIGEPADRGGFVHVLYGTGSGLTADGDQQWSQDRTGVPGRSSETGLFGYSLATGDFDGDRYAELAIGALGRLSAGEVVVLYSGRYGLATDMTQRWTQDSFGVDDEAEPGDGFGGSLAAGDFDGVGLDDLAIGVPGEDSDTSSNTGAVNVIYGSQCGQWTALCADGDQFLTLDTRDVPGRAGADDRFGVSLSSMRSSSGEPGDDLVIGAPGHEVSGFPRAGAATALWSSFGVGLVTDGSQLWTLDSPGMLGRAGLNERFGTTVG